MATASSSRSRKKASGKWCAGVHRESIAWDVRRGNVPCLGTCWHFLLIIEYLWGLLALSSPPFPIDPTNNRTLIGCLWPHSVVTLHDRIEVARSSSLSCAISSGKNPTVQVVCWLVLHLGSVVAFFFRLSNLISDQGLTQSQHLARKGSQIKKTQEDRRIFR